MMKDYLGRYYQIFVLGMVDEPSGGYLQDFGEKHMYVSKRAW
jgi:hypothetical protein